MMVLRNGEVINFPFLKRHGPLVLVKERVKLSKTTSGQYNRFRRNRQGLDRVKSQNQRTSAIAQFAKAYKVFKTVFGYRNILTPVTRFDYQHHLLKPYRSYLISYKFLYLRKHFTCHNIQSTGVNKKAVWQTLFSCV